mmetsp:Transcript_7564/g.10712  ORF Transcript_7564/g.10712 Transcript_7564/m.10712 type:complete len:256 (+) Transcript_7564:289-1056(+)
MRFLNMVSSKASITFMTEYCLLNELVSTRNNIYFSTLIIDEFHERSLYTDLIIGLIDDTIRTKIKSIKLIIMTATYDYQKTPINKSNSRIIIIKGTFFKRKIYYTSRTIQNYLIAALLTIKKLIEYNKKEDILVFFTGKNELLLSKLFIEKNFQFFYLKRISKVRILYSHFMYFYGVPLLKKFKNKNSLIKKLEIFLSTNIAETSITLHNLSYVIDTGYTKLQFYNPIIKNNSLKIIQGSKGQFIQRSGRIGILK